ncbi:MAG: hypothetical protein ACREE6_00145 [Limisphaerales bacterium]
MNTTRDFPQDVSEIIDRAVQISKGQICEMFLKAVEEHDGKTIREIAKAVWFFKGKIKKPPFIPESLKEREGLLRFKEFARTVSFPITIDDVIGFLGLFYGIQIDPSDDHSALRAKCKAHGIKLVHKSKIRPKK